jgi:hypothetical protein
VAACFNRNSALGWGAGSAAIGHGVFSRGLGGNASSTRALEMGKGETSNWAEMCASGLALIDAANNSAKL